MASWKCPIDGSTDLMVVVTRVNWAWLRQHVFEDGSGFETEIEDEHGDHEWGADSQMRCQACGHLARSEMFEVKEADQ